MRVEPGRPPPSRIDWQTIGRIIKRVADEHLGELDRLSDLFEIFGGVVQRRHWVLSEDECAALAVLDYLLGGRLHGIGRAGVEHGPPARCRRWRQTVITVVPEADEQPGEHRLGAGLPRPRQSAPSGYEQQRISLVLNALTLIARENCRISITATLCT